VRKSRYRRSRRKSRSKEVEEVRAGIEVIEGRKAAERNRRSYRTKKRGSEQQSLA
jgi:hypothetical protein